MERKYVKVVLSIIIVVMIIVSLFIIAINLNGGSADFSDCEIRIVITDSMDHDSHDGILKTNIQSIPVNSMIMIHKLDDAGKKNLKVGDVIAFWKGSELYTHRIIAINADEQTVTTRGDNTSSEDPPVPMSNVYGKVMGVNTPIGIVAEYIRANPVVSILIVVLAFIAVCAIEYAVKEIRNEKKNP